MSRVRRLVLLSLVIWCEGVTLCTLDHRHQFVGLIWWIGFVIEMAAGQVWFLARRERRRALAAEAAARRAANLTKQLGMVGLSFNLIGVTAAQAAAQFQQAMTRLQATLSQNIPALGDTPTIYKPVPAHFDSPVIGWRSWAVYGVDGELGARFQPIMWEATQIRARCLKAGDVVDGCDCPLCRTKAETAHHAPAADCTCGIYATYAPFPMEWPCGLVIGWGRVQFHRVGWRSEFAKILAIAKPPEDFQGVTKEGEVVLDSRQACQKIAERYGVPILSVEALCELAKEWTP